MKNFQNIAANAITGAIIGSIFLLPYLGWLYSGHGIIMLRWTTRFLVVGIIWGAICGVAIGFVPIMINSSIKLRITMGMLIGGLSGIIFYLIGDLAFLTDDSFSTTLLKSLWGFGFGTTSGSICALVLRSLYPLLSWIRVKDDFNAKHDQDRKHQFRERILSAVIGFNMATFLGNFLFVFIGQIIITMYGAIYFREILLIYPLLIIFGSIAAIYLYLKPLQKQQLQKIMDGLRNGIVFALMSILYYSILTFMIVLLPLPKPEFMSDDLFLGFVLFVVGVFTLGFGFACGITGATFDEFFAQAKAKLKNAA